MNWKALNPFEPLTPASTPDEMRAAIENAQLHHPIVRQVLMVGRGDGLRGEDLYSMMAYYALQQMVSAQRQVYEMASMAPPLPVLVPADLVPDGVQRVGPVPAEVPPVDGAPR